MHLLGQSADVVVALDDLAGDVERLDAVRVDGALGEPLGVSNLFGLGIEDLDEVAAYDFAFLLGFGDACQVAEELLGGIDADDVESEDAVVVEHLLELVLAQHAVVDEDAGEALSDGFVEQYGGNAGVYAAGESEDDAVVA